MATLEALFERYRTRGELAALGEIFDRTSAGLLALAVHLVRDPVEAEDLVQATFVAAIEGAGSFQNGRRLEPWLAGILARQAARVWRNRGRAVEGRAELDPTLDPSFAAEKRELADALELAFTRLAPREREVLRRYLDGEAPLDIARSQGRGAGAVRMQVLRGLEKLRRLLPSSLHALLPLARLPRSLEAVRAEVLAHAGGAAVLAPAAVASLALGVLAMSTKLILGALAVSALVFVSLRPWSVDPVELASSATTVPARVETAPAAPLELKPSTSSAREERAPSNEASPVARTTPAPKRDGLWLAGNLIGLEGLDPALTVISVRGPSSSLIERGSPDGTFALDANPLGPRSPGCALLHVQATHPGWRRAQGEVRIDDALRQRIAAGYTEVRIDLDLSPLTAVVGRVEPGQAQVALARDGSVVLESGELESDDGSFALFPPEGGTFELLVRAQGRLPLKRTVRVAQREVLDLGTLVLDEGGVALAGHFVPKELLREGLWLSASRVDPGVEEELWAGTGLRSGRVGSSKAPVAADGTFRFVGLEPGHYVLSLDEYLGGMGVLTLGYSEAAVHAPRSGVEFGRELGLVRFHLRGERIELPATLMLSDRVETSPGEFRENNRGLQLTDMRTVELLVDRRHAFSASVRAAGTLAAKRDLPAGRSFLHEEIFELQPDRARPLGNLELSWELPEWLELPRRVQCHLRTEDDSWNFNTQASATGCRLERVLPGHYRLIVVPEAEDVWAPLPSFAGSRPIDIVIEPERTTHAKIEWLMGGRARFRPPGEPRSGREALEAEVRDALGERCVGHFAFYEHDAEGNLNTGSFAQLPLLWPSEFEPNLPPGSYTLVLFEAGRESAQELVQVPFAIQAGELVEVPVVLPD